MPEIDGNKKVTLEELKLVHDLKLDKDFSGMTALPQSPADSDLLAIQNGSTTYKVPVSAISPSPLVVAITSGQWSGSGSDYYISVNASNVTADSILVPSYDSTSASNLKGPVWCVPAAGSFTIHTSAVPSGTVNVLVQFPGVMGEANYQVLADVYSKSQTYSKTEAVAKADVVNNLTSTATNQPLSAAQGKAIGDRLQESFAVSPGSSTTTGQAVKLQFKPTQSDLAGKNMAIIANTTTGLTFYNTTDASAVWVEFMSKDVTATTSTSGNFDVSIDPRTYIVYQVYSSTVNQICTAFRGSQNRTFVHVTDAGGDVVANTSVTVKVFYRKVADTLYSY